MEQEKSVSYLVRRLRFLKTAERKKFLTYLDGAVKNQARENKEKTLVPLFYLQSLAYLAYYLLEGEVYAQPEFSSQITQADIRNREKFDAILSGIVIYSKSSEKDKATFRKKVLKNPNVFQSIWECLKKHQNTRG